jgi:hypothetical protein
MTPATDWKEVVPDGEPAHVERLAEQRRDIQREAARGKPPRRALHAKAHVNAAGTFEVLPDLPEHARAGVFAAPKTYRAYVRFSNGAKGRQSDTRGDQRGVALKLSGVAGKKIIPGLEGCTTQDFLLIRNPMTPFVDATDFVWLVAAMRSPALLVPKLLGKYGPISGIRMLKKLIDTVSTKTPSMATVPYFSALPTRYGAYAAKFKLEPHQRQESNGVARTADYLSDDLVRRLAQGPLSWDFRVQFFVDEARTPIEDASVEWTEADAPFTTVARLTLPKQDVKSEQGQKLAERVEAFSFDPWHATEDFRPLGAMMRARNAAYRLSTQERKAAAEPTD